ncbi:MAG: ribosome maturation factor RimP [Brevinemataceae bacterium]
MTHLDIIESVKDWIATLKYTVLECSLTKSNNKHILKIVIFNPEKPINSEDCASAAEIISRRLDIEDFFAEPYDLIVESPGVEREIKSPAEYQYFIGKEFKIFPDEHVSTILTKDNFFIAELISIDGEQLIFQNNKEKFKITINEIKKAKLHCDYSKIFNSNKKNKNLGRN